MPVSLFIRGVLLALMGRIGDAQDVADLMRRPGGEQLSLLLRAQLPDFVGDPRQLRTAAQELARFGEDSGVTQTLIRGDLWLGVAHLRESAFEPAIERIERALSRARESRTSLHLEAQMIAYLAEATLGSGDNRRARELALEAVARASSQGARIHECQAQIALARALCTGQRPDRADAVRAALDRARDLAESTGARFFEPQIHEVSAEFARELGNETHYERDLREAHRLYTEMGATGHAERLARELAFQDRRE
jgi:tetratricopeptide (TPR) repeat protein